VSAQFNDYLEQLKNLNVETRRALERAELQIGSANQQLALLNATGLFSDQIVLGDLLLQRNYSARFGAKSDGQIIQAALALPGGFGAIFWDSEEFAALHQAPELESEAFLRFTPFDELPPAIKALLVTRIEPVLGEVLRRIGALL
jgi:hypothetical protein